KQPAQRGVIQLQFFLNGGREDADCLPVQVVERCGQKQQPAQDPLQGLAGEKWISHGELLQCNLFLMPSFRVGVTPDFYTEARSRFEAFVQSQLDGVPGLEWGPMPP